MSAVLSIDLDAIGEQLAAKVAAKLLKQLPELLRAESERQRQAEILFSDAVAARYGKKVEAFNRWLSRKGGQHIAAIAITRNGKRCWRRVDLELLEAERRTVLPAAPGGGA